jgi:sphinganine C4-monooxygenase
MHSNRFLYKQIHSWHHRLYVPYAFGSLYNHPLEVLFLDSIGALVAEWMTGMSTRQVMLLFTISTMKTVDDHCGYKLPWDPLQWLTGNNADYHDIHHQVCGVLLLAFYTSLTYVQGYWHEIKFLSAPFCTLGCTSWNEDDTGRH